MDYEKKLKNLRLRFPSPPKPVANYLPVVRSGNLLFLSGMLPFVDGKLTMTGKIGKECTIEEGQEAARIALLNGLSVIKQEMGSLNYIEQIVRIAVYVASAEDFFQQPAVANGASDLLAEIFGTAGRHARLALGVSVLPLNSVLELEMIVEICNMAPPGSETDTFVV